MTETGTQTKHQADKPSSRDLMVCGVAATSAATGLGALAASSCCLAQTVLAWHALGAGAVGLGLLSAIEFLARWRLPLLLASAVFVIAGWTTWLRQRRRASGLAPRFSGMSVTTAAMLVTATLCLAGAVGWDYMELRLTVFLKAPAAIAHL